MDEHILGKGQCTFIVNADEEVAGLLTLHGVKETARASWPTTTVGQATVPIAHAKRICPEAGLWAALEMDRDGVNQLPVMEDGRLLAMLTREGISGFLRTRAELGA